MPIIVKHKFNTDQIQTTRIKIKNSHSLSQNVSARVVFAPNVDKIIKFYIRILFAASDRSKFLGAMKTPLNTQIEPPLRH